MTIWVREPLEKGFGWALSALDFLSFRLEDLGFGLLGVWLGLLDLGFSSELTVQGSGLDLLPQQDLPQTQETTQNSSEYCATI